MGEPSILIPPWLAGTVAAFLLGVLAAFVKLVVGQSAALRELGLKLDALALTVGELRQEVRDANLAGVKIRLANLEEARGQLENGHRRNRNKVEAALSTLRLLCAKADCDFVEPMED